MIDPNLPDARAGDNMRSFLLVLTIVSLCAAITFYCVGTGYYLMSWNKVASSKAYSNLTSIQAVPKTTKLPKIPPPKKGQKQATKR